MSGRDTIFAESTAGGRAAVAIVRLSGCETANALTALTGLRPRPREARLAWIRDPRNGERIDQGLVLWFPGPHSFTGEDCAELQVHGGRAVVSELLAILSRIPRLRPAEPGEFTRRALLNGKMDLVGVEGLGDLIAAETQSQRRLAMTEMDGRLSALYESWRERIVREMAEVEAVIDFADEDLPDGIVDRVDGSVQILADEISAHLEGTKRAEKVRDGLRVAIVGPPNVGKSSLINRLAERDVAIVSAEAGTTRDVIEAHLDLNGFPVLVSDGAGLRDNPSGAIEAEGIRRARAVAEAADIVVPVLAANGPWQEQSEAYRAFEGVKWLTINKADLVEGNLPRAHGGLPVIGVSCKTGGGLEEAVETLASAVSKTVGTTNTLIPARERHGNSLMAAHRYLSDLATEPELELKAESLRLAALEIGRITGRVDVEDVLDVLFKGFCIGK